MREKHRDLLDDNTDTLKAQQQYCKHGIFITDHIQLSGYDKRGNAQESRFCGPWNLCAIDADSEPRPSHRKMGVYSQRTR
jgi:hypothetical protein